MGGGAFQHESRLQFRTNLKQKRRTTWAGHVSRVGEMRNAYKILVGKPDGKRPLGRPRRRREDNIKMDDGNRVGRCGLNSSGSG
jgi:hypothetical protein